MHKSLTKLGYILEKDKLNQNEIQKIKKDLTVKPTVIQAFADFQQDVEAYPIYLESPKRFFLPRFYGVENFGEPSNNLIKEGVAISIQDKINLMEHQYNAYDTTVKHLKNTGGGVLSLPCGAGKCLGKDTPIMMYNGTFKMSQDIKPGDQLMGDDSTPRNVLTTCTGREMLYKVIPTKGDPYVVNESHILSLTFSSDYTYKKTKYKKGDVIDMPLMAFINLSPWWHTRAGYLRGYRVPVKFPHKQIDFDPYLLGHWLGDGHKKGAYFTSIDQVIIDYYTDYCKKHGLFLKEIEDTRRDDNITYQLTNGERNCNDTNHFYQFLKRHNLLFNKHIPDLYKYNSRDIQLQVLAGIIDSDGHMNHNMYDLVLKSEKLTDDVIFICRSLGFACYKSECQKTCMNATSKTARKTGTYYRIGISGEGLDELPLKIDYKRAQPRKQIKNTLVTKITVEKLEVGDYYGFTIDGNRRFLLGDFQVTHNTVVALKIIATLKLKTIVIVNKEFLMDQWIERITQFLPDAKVGIIQQNKVQVADRDIVIGMIHSISLKDYPKDTFDDFGLAIVDETHHASAKMFSKSLPKIACRYQLGLSATPNRRDGLSYVFYYYLGPLFHSERRSGMNRVIIKQIKIKSDSPSYDVVYKTIRGKQYKNSQAMIGGLTEFTQRNLMILELIKELVTRQHRKILLLSDRREHLELFNDKLLPNASIRTKDNKFATYGLYYGKSPGTNKKNHQTMLESTSKCDIVLGTCQMASEALDIPSLNTLIFATPMTDVEQASGRILRKFHKDLNPMIIDIIDLFGNFEKHGKEREKYFKSEDYIIQTLRINLSDNPQTNVGDLEKVKEYINDTKLPDPRILKQETFSLPDADANANIKKGTKSNTKKDPKSDNIVINLKTDTTQSNKNTNGIIPSTSAKKIKVIKKSHDKFYSKTLDKVITIEVKPLEKNKHHPETNKGGVCLL